MAFDNKWPTLTVTGPSLTREQTEQILVRCDGLDLHCNDRTWTDAAHQILTGGVYPWTPETPDERVAAVLDQCKNRERLGLLSLRYLDTDRFSSAAKGSTGSWLDWDGTLGGCAYSIGKWPSTEEITEEWEQIAAAVPFLQLRSQLTSYDWQADATRPPAHIWGTWDLADGAVLFDEDALEPLGQGRAPWAMGQQHLELEHVREIVGRVLGPTMAAAWDGRGTR